MSKSQLNNKPSNKPDEKKPDAPPPGETKTDAPPAAATEAEKKRTRGPNPVTAMAVHVIALLAVCEQAKIQSPAIEAAKAAVAEINEKTVKPITDRISVIETDFKALAADLTVPGAAEKAVELSKELQKLRAKLAGLQGTPTTVAPETKTDAPPTV